MKTKEFVSILENIEELIEKENYEEIVDYINKEKIKLSIEEDAVNEYVDRLAKKLK